MGYLDLQYMQARRLAEEHIRHFRNLIRSGRADVRLEECHHYLAIWKSVLEKTMPGFDTAANKEKNWETVELTEQEKGEIYDAVTCGDYDELLEKWKDTPP